MRFRILGPLEVWQDGRRCKVGGPQQRGLLAVLLLNANRVVPVPRLVECLWGDDPPATARGLLQGCIADLRRALGPGKSLLTRAPGYLLEVKPGELDLEVFERLAAHAEYGEALALWRGPPLADIDLQVCRDEAVRLEERRLAVLGRRIDADLAAGDHAGLVPELRLVEELGIDPGPDLRQLHHDLLSDVDTTSAQLPAATAGFTGRDEQLKRLNALTP